MARIQFLFILLNLFINEGVCQKAGKENFLRISKSYLQYQVKNNNLDSNTIIFVVAANTFKQDSLWFEITFDNINSMVDAKYSNIYKLGNFKLIVDDEFNKSYILKEVFKQTIYEDINKGKRDGVRRDDFHRWFLNMNNKYEVTSIDVTVPIKEVVEVLKKNKVKFSKNFRCN